MAPSTAERIAEILLKHDPIRLYFPDHDNRREYAAEAREIAERLPHCTGPDECLYSVYITFVRNFGVDAAGGPERYREVAAEIWMLQDSPPGP